MHIRYCFELLCLCLCHPQSPKLSLGTATFKTFTIACIFQELLHVYVHVHVHVYTILHVHVHCHINFLSFDENLFLSFDIILYLFCHFYNLLFAHQQLFTFSTISTNTSLFIKQFCIPLCIIKPHLFYFCYYSVFFPLYRYTSSLLVVDGTCVVDVVVALHVCEPF